MHQKTLDPKLSLNAKVLLLGFGVLLTGEVPGSGIIKPGFRFFWVFMAESCLGFSFRVESF